MARFGSRQKRSARKAKQRRRECESNVSNVGGLFAIGSAYERSAQKQPLSANQVTDIKLATRISLQNMVAGQSTEHDWGMVAGSINTALILAENGYGIEHEDVFIRAQEALVRSHIRGTNTHVWRFDGPGLQDVRDAVDPHEQQCDLVTIADITAALTEVERRLNNGIVFDIEQVTA